MLPAFFRVLLHKENSFTNKHLRPTSMRSASLLLSKLLKLVDSFSQKKAMISRTLEKANAEASEMETAQKVKIAW